MFAHGLARALARTGRRVDEVSLAWPGQEPVVAERDPDVGRLLLDLGVTSMTKRSIAAQLEHFAECTGPWVEELGASQVLYSHYWLSGAYWALAREEFPRLARVHWAHSFHSLGRVRTRFADDPDAALRIGWEERTIAEADAIIVNSEAEAADLRNLYEAVPRRLTIVPGGCSTSPWNRPRGDELRRRLGLGDAAIVLYVGRLEARKGYRIFLEVARALRDDARFTFVLVGGRAILPYEDRGRREAEAFIARERLENVALLPAVPHAELPAIYRSADAIVLPSLYEPFGLTAIEAQASGCIPIASAVGGLTATVADGRTGFLTEPDAAAIAERLTWLADDPVLQARLREEGVRWATERFSWDRLAPRYLAALRPIRERALTGPAGAQ